MAPADWGTQTEASTSGRSINTPREPPTPISYLGPKNTNDREEKWESWKYFLSKKNIVNIECGQMCKEVYQIINFESVIMLFCKLKLFSLVKLDIICDGDI